MKQSITVECPHCGEGFVVVEPESHRQEEESNSETPNPITAELLEWEEADLLDPYTGNDKEIPVAQCVKADIRIDGEERSFTFWYTPEYGKFKYVVRGQLQSGMKSKDIYVADGELFFINRGVPRNVDKQWTYLDRNECARRSRLAGLGDVTADPAHANKDNRFRIFLDEQQQPLVDDSGDVAEDLLLKLAKGLLVLQTAR